jgi:hypothetical protein
MEEATAVADLTFFFFFFVRQALVMHGMPPLPPINRCNLIAATQEFEVDCFICSRACANALRFKRAFAKEHLLQSTFSLFLLHRAGDGAMRRSTSHLAS